MPIQPWTRDVILLYIIRFFGTLVSPVTTVLLYNSDRRIVPRLNPPPCESKVILILIVFFWGRGGGGSSNMGAVLAAIPNSGVPKQKAKIIFNTPQHTGKLSRMNETCTRSNYCR